MTVGFRASFAKDLETIQDVRLLRRGEKVIRALERAESPGEVSQIKRLQGYPQFCRIRIGDYRMGLRVEGNQVDCVWILHRREIPLNHVGGSFGSFSGDLRRSFKRCPPNR